ncbi:MAG: DUF3899 domain-containing protein [Bacilli bacterium]|jgi:hypothetical protein
MKDNNKRVILKYAIAIVVAIAFFFLIVGLRNLFKQTELKEIYRILADGFTYPGIFYIGSGFLLFAANQGSFRGIGYALKRFVLMLIPFSKKKHETYADYLAKERTIKGYLFLFIIGGVFLLVAVVFIILFYTVN